MIEAMLALALLTAPGDPPIGASAPTPEARFRSMRDAYQAAFDEFVRLGEAAKTPEDEAKVLDHPGRRPGNFAAGFMDLAREQPGSAVAEDALLWVCTHVVPHQADAREARRRLARDHARSDRLGPALGFQGHYGEPFEGAGAFFRAILAESPHRQVRGQAAYWLARHLALRAELVREVNRPDFRPPSPDKDPYGPFGPDWPGQLRPLDAGALDREADALFEEVERSFADVPHNDKRRSPGTLGEAARSYLRERHELAVGRPAPDFEGVDLDGKPFRLVDARGRVVVLDFGSHFYCGACRLAYPLLRDLSRRLDGEKFTLVSINAEPEKVVEDLKGAWAAEGNTWPCLFDGDWEGPIQKRWNVQAFPTFYVLDPRGTIRHKLDDPRRLGAAVDALLAEAKADPAPAPAP